MYDVIGTDFEGNEVRLVDKLPDEGAGVDEEVELDMQVRTLKAIVDSLLSGREKLVIQMRYGLGFNNEMTQREVATKLNISRSYVSRIEKKALKMLKKELERA